MLCLTHVQELAAQQEVTKVITSDDTKLSDSKSLSESPWVSMRVHWDALRIPRCLRLRAW